MGKLDDELIAVITAALNSSLKRPGTNLVVKSIKRTGSNSPVWNITGRLERLSRRLST